MPRHRLRAALARRRDRRRPDEPGPGARPRVVVVGGGFGGLRAALGLEGAPFEVTVVDRTNYHLFTPLLYQVATCLLAPSEIAEPLRKVFRRSPNVRVVQGEVVAVDAGGRVVRLADGRTLPWDRLVLAPGSTTNTFGRADVADHAFELKDLPGALELRNHVLRCLEAAASATGAERARLLAFCVVGGGPTGVETAGAFAELVRLVVPLEYPELGRHEARVVLVEGTDRLLSTFHDRLGRYARARLEHLGVEVRTGVLVDRVDAGGVALSDGSSVPSATVVWAAGVRPEAGARPDGAPLGPGGRLEVDATLRVRGLDGVFAVGDVAAAHGGRPGPLPMVAQPAIQAGRHVAAELRREVAGGRARPFRYHDLGSMATIGRRAAVAEIGPLRLTGFAAFVLWAVVHVAYLVGFDDRLTVMLRWSWYYLRWERPVRLDLRARDRADAGDRP